MDSNVGNLISRKAKLRAATVAIGVCSVLAFGTSQASAYTPTQTVYYSTLSACKAGERAYSSPFTAVTKRCTASGRSYYLKYMGY